MEEYYRVTNGYMDAYVWVSDGYEIEELNEGFAKWHWHIWAKGDRDWCNLLMNNPDLEICYELSGAEYLEIRRAAALKNFDTIQLEW